MNCPYCKKEAEKATGKEIYPNRQDLFQKKFFICKPCDARVGCHEDGTPFGVMANSELRIARMEAHEYFDAIWKEGYLSRTKAYLWLSKELNISCSECHIGMFDIKKCNKTIKMCESQSFRNKK